jgi:phage terminase large subunit-like protein
VEVLALLKAQYLEDPKGVEELAREFGVWEELREEIIKPLRIALCRKDINAFVEYTQIDPETDEYAIQQPFHIEWQDNIAKHKRVLIAAPRGHGKTIQIVCLVVWTLGHNPNTRIKIIGSSDEKAKEILGLVKEMIESNEHVHEVFPDLKIDTKRGDTKGAFFVVRNIPQRDPSVEAAGVLSGGAGGRADLLICDDVVDMKNAVINPADREKVINVVKQTWFSLVASKGRIVWICTPYHISDASHDLKNNAQKIWHIWWTPAIEYEIQYTDEGDVLLDENGKPVVHKRVLWPTKWDEETLENKRAELGERAFTRQYLLNAMSDEERTFPDESLKKSLNFEIADIGELEGGEPIPDNWATYGGVDLGATMGKKSSWSVIWTLAKNPVGGKLYLKEIWRRRVTFARVVEAIKDQFKRHLWRRVNVENNAYQQAVVDALEADERSIPVKGFTTGASNKANEEIGLPGLNVAIEKGNFAFPAARMNKESLSFPPDEVTPLSVFWSEITNHPGGEHTDTIMALWFAYRASLEDAGNYEDTYLDCVEAA